MKQIIKKEGNWKKWFGALVLAFSYINLFQARSMAFFDEKNANSTQKSKEKKVVLTRGVAFKKSL